MKKCDRDGCREEARVALEFLGEEVGWLCPGCAELVRLISEAMETEMKTNERQGRHESH